MMRTLPLIAGSLTFLTVGLQEPSVTDVTGDTYTQGDTAIRLLTVCNINADSVACWNATGQPDASLTDQVRMQVSGRSQSIQIRVGMRNRYFLIQSTGAGSASMAHSQWSTYMEGDTDNSRMMLSGAAFPPDTAQTDVIVDVSGVPTPQVGSFELRDGAIGSVGDIRLIIGKSTRVDTRAADPNLGGPMSWNAPPTKPLAPVWQTPIEFPDLASMNRGYTIQPVDANGKPINYVDKTGRPVPDREVAKAERPGARPMGYPGYAPIDPDLAKRGIEPIRVSLGGAIGTARNVYLNVDPRYVRQVNLTMPRSTRIRFVNVPLDPR